MSSSEETPQPQPLTSLPCPICQQKSYIWGIVWGHPEITFKANDAGFFQSYERVRARRCQTCGNIQLFGTENSW